MARSGAPVHLSPGDVIKQKLDDRGWKQRDLAYVLGCHEQIVNLLVTGKRGISPEMAKALGAAFNESADFFLSLQKSYDLLQARDPDPGIALRAQLRSYPIRDMIRRGWLSETGPTSLEDQMLRFFEATSTGEINLPHAGKKSRYEQTVPPPQLAWLFRVRQIAHRIEVPRYSQDKFVSILPHLRQLLADPEKVADAPAILNKCGIRIVFVEPLPSGKIDGACLWLNSTSPVIGMSLRFDRIDNFWFVFRHEAEHVLQEDGQADEIGMVDELEGRRSAVDASDLPREERIANRAAAEFCVPQRELLYLIKQRGLYMSERDVLGLARRFNVHPGIVVGQIHSRTGRYNFLRKYLIKIRHVVLQKASFVDGWGQVFQAAD